MKIINRFAKNVLITMVIISLVSMPYERRVKAAESPFTDIVSHWGEEYINNTYNRGIIEGYPDGTFKPDGKITRAEMAVMIIKAMGLDSVEKPNLEFTDAKDIPSWAAGYIKLAVDKGIIVGYPDGTFKPNAFIRREEIAVMVVKAVGFADPEYKETVFADNDSIPSTWARAFVAKAYDLGIIKGSDQKDQNGRAYFFPNNNATRAEACAIIDKMCILYNINTGEAKSVSIDDANNYPGFVKGSNVIQIYSRIDGHQSSCLAEELESMIAVNWVTGDTQLTMYDAGNNTAPILGRDISAKLSLGWAWEKRTDIQEAWKIPDTPSIGGATVLDMTITRYVNKINNEYIPDIKNADNTIKKQGSASRYYDAAIAQVCLPPKYTITPENRDQSIALISEDLKWNQGKIDKLWQVCSEKSKEYGNVIDPRLLFAVIMIEGTGSFDTNAKVSGLYEGSYIQPDFDADLTKAFNNHIFGKIWAYPNYAKEFEAASVAAAKLGKQFIVIDQMTPPTVVTYTGKGDLFEYINNSVPRIKWNTSTNQWEAITWGVYAMDYNWCNNLRGLYEVMAGTGTAVGYSEFLKANPVPWPSGLSKPTGSFVLTNIGQGWPYWYSGYPMLNFVPTP